MAAAFHSDQTPAFGNMVASLFANSNGAQMAGLLNQLMGSVNPAMLTQLLAGRLAGMMQGGGTQQTPEQAQQVTPEMVQQMAAHAARDAGERRWAERRSRSRWRKWRGGNTKRNLIAGVGLWRLEKAGVVVCLTVLGWSSRAQTSMRAPFFAIAILLAAIFFLGQASAAKHTSAVGAHGGSLATDEAAHADAASTRIIVIGFVGGYVRHDNAVHSTVQLAARIREEYPSGAYINTFANHDGEDAHQAVLHALDADHDGELSAAEKRNARIVIYGHSWGASETVALADALNRDGIPVLLTIQVDSVAKHGENDAVIPPNVAEAVNYYQKDGLLHGRSAIRAADPKRTHVIGNFRFAYGAKPIACEAAYPWWDRLVMQQHIEIECDPKVWHAMESLIRATLSSTGRVIPDSSSANATAATASRNPAP